ncbi:E3 ubiquitin-ligase RNF144B-like [Brachionus plicatilis]|uniref:RBR-type E3 ubiquitin transferase n=1 Tax=Brachionus plicatilis TaxID=10195 RepID=A0A3M7T389_BRAPC|nr:E3 ubiquitin-ligase RNF144B-like [Brachionus plicatilis]
MIDIKWVAFPDNSMYLFFLTDFSVIRHLSISFCQHSFIERFVHRHHGVIFCKISNLTLTTCLHEYVKYSIQNCNVLPIQCPDSKCKYGGYLTDAEIQLILNTGDETDINNNTYSSLEDMNPQGEKACFIEPNKNVDLYERYLSLCEEFRIMRDPSKVYCPQPLCQNICTKGNEKKIVCDKCSHEFCVQCSKACKENGVTVDSCTCATSSECPNCSILIERADGCAQIMCKICKHTFCFYCLTSLEKWTVQRQAWTLKDVFVFPSCQRGRCLFGHHRPSSSAVTVSPVRIAMHCSKSKF